MCFKKLGFLLLLTGHAYASTTFNCTVYNKDQPLTTKTITIDDNDYPSSWARNNPAQFVANQYRPALCQTVGLGSEGQFKQASINGKTLRNVKIYQKPSASEDCSVRCTTQSEVLKTQDQHLSIIAESGGYLAAH